VISITENTALLPRPSPVVFPQGQMSLPLVEASAFCNREIVSRCDQLICFAFHDSETLLASCRLAEDMGKVVTLLFFD
jgi:hypothetical protein